MTQAQFAQRRDRATTEPFVISSTPSGFRIYAPTEPGQIYEVSGTPEAPTCTCPDFRFHRNDPAWRCKHILAVLSRPNGGAGGNREDSYDAEERAAIQEEGRSSRRKRPVTSPSNVSQMLLKRSISPDGRIDALSVEFSCPVENGATEIVVDRALDTLALQDAIIERFLRGRNGTTSTSAPGNGSVQPSDDPDTTPAELLSVDGMNGKWGRRLFLTVQANGRRLRLFGTQKQLTEAIAAAGFPEKANGIAEGLTLNLPCRVRTEPTTDGRYLNITEVLPASPARSAGRRP